MAQSADRERTVAVVGATGAVGEVVLRLLAERRFPVGELRALASGRSAGSKVRFAGREVEVREARAEAFEGVDFAFFAATGSLSKELAPEVARRGGSARAPSRSRSSCSSDTPRCRAACRARRN